MVHLGFSLRRVNASGFIRSVSVGVGTLVVLSLAIVSGALSTAARQLLGERLVMRLPLESQVILALGAALFVAGIGKSALARRELRGAGLVAMAAALVVVLRSLEVVWQVFAPPDTTRSWVEIARVFATLEWGVLALAAGLALAWAGTARSARLTLPEWAHRIRVCSSSRWPSSPRAS